MFTVQSSMIVNIPRTEVMEEKFIRGQSFYQALKEKYLEDEYTPANFIVIRKPDGRANLAHMKIIVLNGLDIVSSGIPSHGLADLCPNVVDLDLASNMLKNWAEVLAILQHFPKLNYVSLNHNPLHIDTKHDGSSNHLQIEVLALNHTGVSIDEVLALSDLMPCLKELQLDANGYSNLASIDVGIDLGAFQALEVLRLHSNKIEKWSEVWKLRNLPNLKSLIISDNPLSDLFYYTNEEYWLEQVSSQDNEHSKSTSQKSSQEDEHSKSTSQKSSQDEHSNTNNSIVPDSETDYGCFHLSNDATSTMEMISFLSTHPDTSHSMESALPSSEEDPFRNIAENFLKNIIDHITNPYSPRPTPHQNGDYIFQDTVVASVLDPDSNMNWNSNVRDDVVNFPPHNCQHSWVAEGLVKDSSDIVNTSILDRSADRTSINVPNLRERENDMCDIFNDNQFVDLEYKVQPDHTSMQLERKEEFRINKNLSDSQQVQGDNVQDINDVNNHNDNKDNDDNTDDSQEVKDGAQLRSISGLPPFSNLEVLWVSNACITHDKDLNVVTYFPKLHNLRLHGNKLYSDVDPENRRKLFIASLPNIDVLNGSEISQEEREKAERYFLRHFNETLEKPIAFCRLLEKHGPPVQLADINLCCQEWATLKFVYQGHKVFSHKVRVFDRVGKLREIISNELGFPKRSFSMYFHPCNEIHPHWERDVTELRCENLPMSRFDFADDDEIHIDN